MIKYPIIAHYTLQINSLIENPIHSSSDSASNSFPEHASVQASSANFSSFTYVGIKEISLYTPSEEDISELLKEFTVDFLLNGIILQHAPRPNCIAYLFAWYFRL